MFSHFIQDPCTQMLNDPAAGRWQRRLHQGGRQFTLPCTHIMFETSLHSDPGADALIRLASTSSNLSADSAKLLRLIPALFEVLQQQWHHGCLQQKAWASRRDICVSVNVCT